MFLLKKKKLTMRPVGIKDIYKYDLLILTKPLLFSTLLYVLGSSPVWTASTCSLSYGFLLVWSIEESTRNTKEGRR